MLCLLTAFLAQGCNFQQGSSKTSAKQNISPPPASSDKSFEAFFNRFQVDSNFQKSRIVFPLKCVNVNDDGGTSTTFIAKSKWTYLRLFAANKAKGIIKQTKVNTGSIRLQFQIEDTGYEKDFIFICKNGKWLLATTEDLSD